MKKLSVKNQVLCAMFTALVTVGAFIQVPVPFMDYFTLQFLFVLLSGLLLGKKLGAVSVGCYVFLGLIGLPIFAAGGGPSYIFRPSFGYLLGFICAAFVTGALSYKLKVSFKNNFLSCLAGFLVTYGIGIFYKYFMLKYYTDSPQPLLVIFLSCFPLDIPGDIVLCIIASMLGVRLKRFRVLEEKEQFDEGLEAEA